MPGVQRVGIAVSSLVVIFLVAEYFMANFLATYILTPPSKLCPTPEQIKERKTCEISAERAVYADADFDAYEEWETERFFCENNGGLLKPACLPANRLFRLFYCNLFFREMQSPNLFY